MAKRVAADAAVHRRLDDDRQAPPRHEGAALVNGPDLIPAGLVAAAPSRPLAGDIAAALLAGAAWADATLRERTPRAIGPEIAAFCESLGVGCAEMVRVQPMPGASPNGCHRAVAEAVAAGRGTAAFGVTFWEAPGMFLTAEAHAVLRTTPGELVDVTPKVDRESEICYAVDPRLGPDFDFLKRPNNRHRRTYVSRPDDAKIRGAIACLHGKRLKFTEGLASKAGLSLEQWIASRLPRDPLEVAIDLFLRCSEETQALFVPTRAGLVCRDERAAERLNERRLRLARRMLELRANSIP
jgi:hypothetical protein